MPYSILVLTQNEEINVARCLNSLPAGSDIVVLDSGSTDGTLDVVRRYPVRIAERPFDSFAAQRNWAVDTVGFRHDWILHLDADECLTEPLRAELETVTSRDEHSAYVLANRLFFMGRWIRHASMYPYYQARLLKRGEARFGQVGHGQILAEAQRGVGTIREPYDHHNFSRGITDWVTRHNKYSSDEARRIVSGTAHGSLPGASSGTGKETRQQRLKWVADRVPARPVVRFLYLYIYKLGILDGRPGFDYCLLMAFYDYLTRLKARELRSSLSDSRSERTGEA
ncbi:MAG: glycosyltransferase family 2 protein [Planctomycetes bacterium]|nr:glycosyltransferase family 2 protein [Planctomycetota bacterium]